MININVSGFLTDFTSGQHNIELPSSPTTVGEALDELWAMYPGLKDRVLTELGQIRTHVNIFLGDENVRRRDELKTSLPSDAEITILPAVSGG